MTRVILKKKKGGGKKNTVFMFTELMPSSLKKNIWDFFFSHTTSNLRMYSLEFLQPFFSIYLAFICYLVDFSTIWLVQKKNSWRISCVSSSRVEMKPSKNSNSQLLLDPRYVVQCFIQRCSVVIIRKANRWLCQALVLSLTHFISLF